MVRAKPQWPRESVNYRSRGDEHLFVVTYSAIAKAVGLKRETVRKHAYRKIFDPRNLVSVAAYIAVRAGR